MTNVPESMFPSGSTPYGPPSGQVTPPAASPTYVASPTAWSSPSTPPRPRKNGPGVAAVCVGAFALVVSFAGASASWLFILVTGILGVIALVRPGRPRTTAIIGLVLAGVALFIAIIVTVSRF